MWLLSEPIPRDSGDPVAIPAISYPDPSLRLRISEKS
jgi:hypothetical protein